MTNTMTVAQESSNGSMTVYDRVNDPLVFVEQMGKVFAHSGACGCKTEPEGKLLALACLCERQSPFDIQRRYHLMDGKLSMKSDVMLAEFRARGGKHKWIKDGSDGKEAVLELTDWDGNVTTTSYSIEDAQNAGIFREGSGWTKNPGNMLRARCSSNAVRMAAPEIVSGIYTPEEQEDISAANGPAPSGRTAAEVQSRREEIIDAANAPFQQEDIVDAVVEEKPSENQVSQSDGGAEFTAIMDVLQLLTEIGMTKEQLEEQLRGQDSSFTNLESLSDDRLQKLATNIRTKIKEASKN